MEAIFFELIMFTGSQDPCAPCGGGFYVNATHAYPDGGTKIAGADGYTGTPVAGVDATAIKTPEECQAKCAVCEFGIVPEPEREALA